MSQWISQKDKCTLHVLYWEAARDAHLPGCYRNSAITGLKCRGCGPAGINFGPVAGVRTDRAPIGTSFCQVCNCVVSPWKDRLDNMQSTLRMVGKSDGGKWGLQNVGLQNRETSILFFKKQAP